MQDVHVVRFSLEKDEGCAQLPLCRSATAADALEYGERPT